jgi:hypothetical protein
MASEGPSCTNWYLMLIVAWAVMDNTPLPLTKLPKAHSLTRYDHSLTRYDCETSVILS